MSSTPSITCRCGSKRRRLRRRLKLPSRAPAARPRRTARLPRRGGLARQRPHRPARLSEHGCRRARSGATTRVRAGRARSSRDATARNRSMSGTQTMRDLVAAVEQVLVGKHAEAELAIIGLAAAGHLLIEDVPGVGKTMLAKSLARATGCTFKRIQFTPDLLPSDVTGVSIFNQRTGEFEFRSGPLVSQFVLADEINRATPKTQSALLEAMEEEQITVDGVTYRLPDPFIVLATQNPIEYEGTFPLPEAQLDRFLLNISMGYPSPADEVVILDRQQRTHPIDSLDQVLSDEDLRALQRQVREIQVAHELREYLVALVAGTRQHQSIYLGASPR